MEIIIGKTAGFCFGVANAVNKTSKSLEEKVSNVYCLGELVHNKQVIEELEQKGLKTIDNINEAKDNLIIRAHGETKEIYKKASSEGLDILDLTCPKVIKIHEIAEDYSKKGYYIFLVGKKEHPEIVATISYCGVDSKIIEDEEQVEKAVQEINNNISKLLVIVQTTFSLDRFNKIVSKIKEKVNKNIDLEIKNTICDATRLRQEETRNISKEVELMIIIGGRHSSNTNKLYEISKENCKNCILVEKADEIDIEEVKKYQKIGIMAGASTPKKSIETVVEMLKDIC